MKSTEKIETEEGCANAREHSQFVWVILCLYLRNVADARRKRTRLFVCHCNIRIPSLQYKVIIWRQPKKKSGETKWPNRALLCTSFCFSCKLCSAFVSPLHKSVCTESTGSSRSLGIVHRSLSSALSHETKCEISKIVFLYRRRRVDLPVTCSSSQSV